MENIIKQPILLQTGPQLDPLQFAFQAAKVFINDPIHKHLELAHTLARLLFAEFSLQPHILADRAKQNYGFTLDDQFILWILDFLRLPSEDVY